MVDVDPTAMQRELYAAGEYYGLSAVLAPAAEVLVAAAEVAAGDRVLDVAAGDGNVALAAAARAAQVAATDLSEVQVQRGRARCERAGSAVAWSTADARRLPFRDGSFDHVLSAFGAVLAPDPQVVARELFRVCVPGGVVALTAWPRDSYMGTLTSAFADLLGEAAIPDRDHGWGDEATVRARLAPYATQLALRRHTLAWDPVVRAAAGAADCAGAYLRSRVAADRLGDVAATRDAVESRFRTADGLIAASYAVIVARAR